MTKDMVKIEHYCAMQIHYHIAFPVECCKASLDREVTKKIIKIAEIIIERYVICINRYHFHLLCSAHSIIAPGKIVRIFKPITA